MLQPGDVLVVDLFGKKEDGTIVGDNLFYYIMKATKGGGLVVDGAIRDLEGISQMDMPAYFRHAHPDRHRQRDAHGINIPVRIGKATVMPGDLVVGDARRRLLHPAGARASGPGQRRRIHIHDEWTRKKFDEGKYKSSEIYGSPARSRAEEGIRGVPQEAARGDPQEESQVVLGAEVGAW